jgi:hypothetical protein
VGIAGERHPGSVATLTGPGSAAVAVCSRMLTSPVSIQMVLWTMRSMIASAWTPPPRRWCQSFFAYWVQNTVEVAS